MKLFSLILLVGSASAFSFPSWAEFKQIFELHWGTGDLPSSSSSPQGYADYADIDGQQWNPRHAAAQIEQQAPQDGPKIERNLLQLAHQLKLNKCVEKMKEVGIHRVINHEGWFTVFCPTDDAFAAEKYYPGADTLTDKMRNHVARGRYNSSFFHNEAVFRSLLSGRDIRINVYNLEPSRVSSTTSAPVDSKQKGRLTTANGRPIVSFNHEARNGFLHVISDVMSAVYDRDGSVITEVDSCCPENSMFVELVKKAGLWDTLHEANPITLLAPLNRAFERLHRDFYNHLMNDIPLLKQVLSAHVIPGTWYTAGLSAGNRLLSWAKDYVVVEEVNGVIGFSNAETSLTDMSAENGVFHSISALIIPKNATAQVKQLLHRLHKNDEQSNIVLADL